MSTVTIGIGHTSLSFDSAPDSADDLCQLARAFEQTGPDKTLSWLELCTGFLDFCAQRSTSLALVVFSALNAELERKSLNIHVAVHRLDLGADSARAVLRSYYALWDAPDAQPLYQHAASNQQPALLFAESAQLLAIFGGQRGVGNCLEEAQQLLDVYGPLLRSYVQRMSEFLGRESRNNQLASAYPQGFDVLTWLIGSGAMPDLRYLESMPVMIPAIGLTQLMQVMVLFKTLGGIAIAAVFSMLSDEVSFDELSTRILGLQMLVGVLPQFKFPHHKLNPRSIHSSVSLQDSVPYPMALVRGLLQPALERHIAEFNSRCDSALEQVYIAVRNTASTFIVTGVTLAVARFAEHLCVHSAHADEDQSTVPFALRKPVVSVSYLHITAPYHCTLLECLVEPIYELAADKGWVLDASSMQLPVRACDDGHDIRAEDNVTRFLVRSMCVLPVDWPVAVSETDTTHIVDFGPGGLGGFGQLAHKNIEGRGIPVICAGALPLRPASVAIGTKADLYQRQMADVVTTPNWLAEFGPRLVRTAHDRKIHIDTRMHRILGAPTVMVAGMTPTTVNEQLVAAVNAAGYHAELAGGGMHSERELADRIQVLAAAVAPGQGITLNCIYINPRQWEFQYPALLRMRNEGAPIAGLCIGGGVPSTEKALEIVDALRAAGIRHMSFKPSSAGVIRQVIQIARASSGFPVVLQWTGGRGGGHHSYEDFHQPILETYASIRACDNLVLVAGSGFGDAEDSLPYITGDWSVEYGRAPMPFDGILLGSRVMVAKEAGTAPAAKALIVAAAGTADADWHHTYAGAANGVTTITSEYGELNHILATRSSMFIREMHSTIFSQPRDKREALLLARKDEIIARLNRDFMRPWFGRKTDGRVVDLEQMTYAEVIGRAVELMYVRHQQRWTSPSYAQFVLNFIDRVECRMCTGVLDTSLSTWIYDTNPLEYVACVVDLYPGTATQLLVSEDVQYFIGLCKRRGQKPPPFIPILDNDFSLLLQKDSIWQSEDLDSIVNSDPQRVGIQQGPVAAKYSTEVDEPVKDILDSIYHGHIAALIERQHGGDASSIPVVEYVGAEPTTINLLASVDVQESETARVFSLPADTEQLPDLDSWLPVLAGAHKSWLRALLTTPTILKSGKYVNNYVRRMLQARPSRTVAVCFLDNMPQSLEISGSSGQLELRLEHRSGKITLQIFQPAAISVATLLQEFVYAPGSIAMPIQFLAEHDAANVQRLFAETWVDNSDEHAEFRHVVDACTEHHSGQLTINEGHIRELCHVIGNRSCQYAVGLDGRLQAPLEFIYISSSPTVLRLLMSSTVKDGQLNIVHLTNHVQLEDTADMLYAGDKLRTVATLVALVNAPTGKLIDIRGQAYVNDKLFATLKSEFLANGCFVGSSRTFKRDYGHCIAIRLPSKVEVTVLEAKEWFIYCEDATQRLTPGAVVEFCLDTEYRYKHTSLYSSIITTGTVILKPEAGRSIHIANVDYQWAESRRNFVFDYLEQFRVSNDSVYFDNGGYALTLPGDASSMAISVPSSNDDYARVSSDTNPIHTNPYIAEVVGLPAPITHGQWTSAATRAIIERCVASERPERIRTYHTEFTGMVLPRDTLSVELSHVGMKRGRMLITGQTLNVSSLPVIKFTVEAEQPSTAYVFTGQGSQQIGMGMDLYKQSEAARAVWDRASTHMERTYGIPLLDIVRDNPHKHTMHFADEAGEFVLRNYLAIKALLPVHQQSADLLDVDNDALCYTITSPTRLLDATQITQPALVVYACATAADMRANGLIQQNAMFAGHSLGEYCALAALGDVLTLEDMLDIAFCRGMIMQSAVSRDAQGRSEFGMAAVDPSRVGESFGEDALLRTIDAICNASPGLLQIVNYNVRGQQYVASGTLTNLAVLRLVLDEMATTSVPADIEPHVSQAVRRILAEPIDSTPTRGKATVPLDGIDVPFHSQKLADGVDALRVVFSAMLDADKTSLAALYGRYIPNLVSVPFDVTQEYVEMVHLATGSPVLKQLLESWDDSMLEDAHEKDSIGMLLLIELLSYQLAAPVQWIKAQDCLFNAVKVQRVVEIGPSPVLCGMATKTLRDSAYADSQVLLLHSERDRDEIYYVRTGEESEAANAPVAQELKVEALEALSTARSALAAPAPVSPPQSSAVGAAIDDVPLPATDIIQVIVAFKLKQPLSAVSVQQTVKALAGGKSILQNEILGDLQKEFGTQIPDKPEEISLQELGAAIGTCGSLGKCTQPLVARMFSSKMPGGFSLAVARGLLRKQHGLGPQRQDALLLVALTMEPASRLASEADAAAWLDQAAQAYAAQAGISYSASGSAPGDSALPGPTVSSAELLKLRQREVEHIQQQMQVLARYAGVDLRTDARVAESKQVEAGALQSGLDDIVAEFGDELIAGVRPQFDARKTRRFDSSWNWARQDAYAWIQQTIAAGGSVHANGNQLSSSDEARLHQLQNRADMELVQMLAGTTKILSASSNPALELAIKLTRALHAACEDALDSPPVFKEFSQPMQPKTSISIEGKALYSEVVRPDEPSFVEFVAHMQLTGPDNAPPPVHLCTRDTISSWVYDRPLSSVYFDGLEGIATQGISFAGKTALVTGCGRGSIGADIVRSLLTGGAKVLATTSSYSRSTTQFFEDMYRQHGSRGSELVVVPFNQGSIQDIDSLASFVFGKSGSALGWDLDYVFPFAAVSDIGSQVINLGSHSELAQRVLLTNVLRLLGSIKRAKLQHKSAGRPALVVLPLSPNHGHFGGDGLYGECKIALETAFNRWKSESWKSYLSIAGAVIGWTRGTGLMSGNNLVAQEIESHGVRTFSTREMAFSILGLLHTQVARIAHRQPVRADLSGGMGRLSRLDTIVLAEQNRIEFKCNVLQRTIQESAAEYAAQYTTHKSNLVERKIIPLLAKPACHFPATKGYDGFKQLRHLQGMVDLDKVVVITGYGEVSPQGNAETRWEIEAFGELTTEGCIELAWIMGLIKHHHSGPLPSTGHSYVGWVDAQSGAPVRDVDIKPRYHEFIMAHTGIRLIEPELVNGYDPARKQVLREVQIEHDMEPFEASADEAAAFKQSNGDKVDVWERDGAWHVRFLKGALIRVPMAASATRLVAGLLPTGWDAARFGIPDDIIKQVDPVTLYMLVATVEALVRSGITDPYELYQHIHVSEIGNTVGCGIGGSSAIQDVFAGRQLDKDVNRDIMQETFISTVQAWVNMLLISGSGPVKPSVGACATGVLAVDSAVEAIQLGKAKVMLAGGVENFFEESSTDFGEMGATSNAVEEFASGREPSEMCRPCASTRNGFMEGQGGGVAVLMSAATAVAIGAPIYGVIAMSATATDKQGRSVPAPGKGVLTTAREASSNIELPMLDFDYRRRGLERQLQMLDTWKADEVDRLKIEEPTADNVHQKRIESQLANLDKVYWQNKRALLDTWGNGFWKQSTDISPLRGSLAVWGLTADDIGMASFHGTSTKANDQNESEVLNAQLQQLGRTPGHAIPVVCQKWLTGHAKGGAASFMLNGVLQSLRTGLVPGNRNADNIAAELEQYGYALYLSKTIQTSGIKAVLMKAFGFGQVGGELLVLHPDYVLAALEERVLKEYNQKLEQRRAKALRYQQDVLVGNHPFVQVKEHPPYTPEQEQQVYLNPLARAHFNPTTGEYQF
ncbi:fatty acid synthase alpha subunit Lsd1 [Coemansia sp. Cherry 401B]|nr:fatty acid synthase alpha subunit Lsd1 [Coemansia sp. Cherry 401B]